MPVSWQSRCRPPAAPTISSDARDATEDARVQLELARRLRCLAADVPRIMMPTPTKKQDQRAADPKHQLSRRTRRRAARLECRRGIARSASGAGSPSRGGARSRRPAASLLRDRMRLFVGSSCWRLRQRADRRHRAQTAPNAADKTATGKPNKATRPHAASRMEAAAIGTGENNDKTVARRNRKRRRDRGGFRALRRRSAADGEARA